jgi:uncharacterized OsmC-like protein
MEDKYLANETATKLKRIQGYKFQTEFDVKSIPNLTVDEVPPIGEGTGPNPSRLLAAAVGQCLSSSLIFCLNKAKVEVKDLETTIRTNFTRNEEGRLRVRSLDVQIRVDVKDEDKKRTNRCLEIFEDYCTVTQSVRKGIEINVKIT